MYWECEAVLDLLLWELFHDHHVANLISALFLEWNAKDISGRPDSWVNWNHFQVFHRYLHLQEFSMPFYVIQNIS